MKLLLHMSLLFLAFNSFCQEIVPAALRNENDTLKLITLKGKVGLIHRDGRQILEPKYTDVRIEPDGIRFYDGQLQGYLQAGKQTAIPANYKEITRVYEYFAARSENGRVDLYYEGELIAGDLDTEPLASDVLPVGNLICIRKEEKSGIIDRTGALIVPMEYSGIQTVSSFEYPLNNSTANYLLVLDKSDYFYSPESEGFLLYGEPVLYLAKADGTPITDSVFTEVLFNVELEQFSLKCQNKLAFIDSGFRIEYTPYVSITEFMEWSIRSTGEESIIFNRFNSAIGTFSSVIIPERMVTYGESEDNELPFYVEKIFEEFVYVTRNNGDTSQMAIYDLGNSQLVSDWEQGITFIRKGKSGSGTAVWIYMNEWGKVAYRISTATKSSKFEYQDIYPVTDRFYALRKVNEPFYALCELVGDSVFEKRAEIDKTFGSFNYSGINTLSVREYDSGLLHGYLDEFGNYYPYSTDDVSETPAILLVPFTLFKNAYGKLGFISWNGKVVDLNADTLFQSSYSSSLIEYRVGNLWGAAEVAYGSFFKPDQPEPNRFRLFEEVSLIYRLADDEKSYVDSKGRNFYSTNIERIISRNGKWKGAKVYSEFEDKEDLAIPFVYSELIPAWNNTDYLVKNADKKWGVLSAFNDTLFPFEYDKLEFAATDGPDGFFPYRDLDRQCLTSKGTGHGILSLNLKKEIPPVYEMIRYVPDAGFIVKKNGKYGVYDYNLDEKIKPVFDELMIGSSLSGVFILRAKKADKWYNLEFFEGMIPDQSTLLRALPCDFVVDELGFVKKQNEVDVVNLMDGSLVQKDAVNDYLSERSLLLKDGKIYILDSKGKVLYPDALTHVVFMEDGTIMSTFNGITYSYSIWKKEKKRTVE